MLYTIAIVADTERIGLLLYWAPFQLFTGGPRKLMGLVCECVSVYRDNTFQLDDL